MAARRSHRDLRLEFADETQLRGGSDPSPSFETRDASPGLRRPGEPSDSISQSEQKVMHYLNEAHTAARRRPAHQPHRIGRAINHSDRSVNRARGGEQHPNPASEAVRRER
jgi:hypothetical protein